MIGFKIEPQVTVIALCFNHAQFLHECLNSIAAQTMQDFQLIVADDCSSDDSANLIQTWLAAHRPDAIFIRHTQNYGICNTLNEALSHASGEFISMIATDDKWRPNRIEHHIRVMQRQTDRVAIVYSDTAQIDEAGNALPNTFLELQRPGFILPSGRVFEALADRNFVHPLAATIRRKSIAAVGGYDERMAVEDYDMWLRLAERYDFVYCPGIVSDYRIVSTSMTRTLFSKPTPKHSYGSFLLGEKWLLSGLLSCEQKARWSLAQADAAYWVYYNDHPHAALCLWKAFKRTHRFRILLLALSCVMGISRSRIKTLANAVGFSRIN